MCGILGLYKYKTAIDQQVFGSMLATLEHRRSDDFGTYYSIDQRSPWDIQLSFRLEFFGLQLTLSNKEKNIWVSFNGEIYNFF
jgi:asparagine synthetase B (glutamine-hydrolysing)